MVKLVLATECSNVKQKVIKKNDITEIPQGDCQLDIVKLKIVRWRVK